MTARKYFYLGCAIGVVVVLGASQFWAERINAEADLVLAGPVEEVAALEVSAAIFDEAREAAGRKARVVVGGENSSRLYKALFEGESEETYMIKWENGERPGDRIDRSLPPGDWDGFGEEPLGFVEGEVERGL